MPDSIRNEGGRLIRDHVLEMPQVTSAGTIAAYYSVGTEPDTRGLVFALWKRGSYVVLPVLLPDGDLDWASYEGPESLAPGRGGGSYDRALARVGPQVPTIALLYDSELLPSVPAEVHDQAVRAVARPEQGITWLPA